MGLVGDLAALSILAATSAGSEGKMVKQKQLSRPSVESQTDSSQLSDVRACALQLQEPSQHASYCSNANSTFVKFERLLLLLLLLLILLAADSAMFGQDARLLVVVSLASSGRPETRPSGKRNEPKPAFRPLCCAEWKLQLYEMSKSRQSAHTASAAGRVNQWLARAGAHHASG